MRVMEIYLQEVQVTTFTERLGPRSRERIQICAGAYASILESTVFFLEVGIPTRSWFFLLRAASGLSQNTESLG